MQNNNSMSLNNLAATSNNAAGRSTGCNSNASQSNNAQKASIPNYAKGVNISIAGTSMLQKN
jgi:hypothetical protein